MKISFVIIGLTLLIISAATTEVNAKLIPDSVLKALDDKITLSKAEYGDCYILCFSPANRTNLLISDLGILQCVNELIAKANTITCDGSQGWIAKDLAILHSYHSQMYNRVNQTKIKNLGFEYLKAKGIVDSNTTLPIP